MNYKLVLCLLLDCKLHKGRGSVFLLYHCILSIYYSAWNTAGAKKVFDVE